MAQKVIPLYTNEVPNAKTDVKNIESEETNAEGMVLIKNVSIPDLTVFIPAKGKANGTSVIICPGGGYGILASKHEGSDVAKEFNKIGVTAFVLKYRLPSDKTMVDKTIGPLQDAQQAIKFVRENASKFNLNPNRICFMGFSAGGHLAATAGTHFDFSVIKNEHNTSLRPDFLMLIYPVISFVDTIGHMGSRENLIGKTPTDEKINWFSNEKHVNTKTPPAFLIHAQDDNAVKVDNSLLFYKALTASKVEAEIHVFPKGGHGFGLINKSATTTWFALCQNWLLSNRWLK